MFNGRLQLDFGDWDEAGRIAISMSPVLWTTPDIGVIIPAGYMSDGASVPRWLWWFLPPWGDRATFAALLHDYLLDRLQGYVPGGPVVGADSRALCDRQFLFACLALSVPAWKAYAAWAGVRVHSIRLHMMGANDPALTQGG